MKAILARIDRLIWSHIAPGLHKLNLSLDDEDVWLDLNTGRD